jgi:hypothetical protein
MSTAYEIPTSRQPQTFTVSLAGVTYTVTLRWNVTAAAWILDLADRNGNPITTGIPLVPGPNLVAQLGYLNLGFSLYTQTDNAPDSPPTFSNLGSTGHLFALLP